MAWAFLDASGAQDGPRGSLTSYGTRTFPEPRARQLMGFTARAGVPLWAPAAGWAASSAALARPLNLPSSVHNTARQLHPPKLERLGLVAAIGGLCRELTHHHGLKIEFTHDQMPAAISPDTALCLYRIAQEGLQNAIKHSGAQQAEVALNGAADAISLRIVDHGRGVDRGRPHGRS